MNLVNEVKVLASHPLTLDDLQCELLAKGYEFVPLILHKCIPLVERSKKKFKPCLSFFVTGTDNTKFLVEGKGYLRF